VSKNKWDKVADIQMARKWAQGAAANDKIYITGGVSQGSWLPESCQCEVYDETTNEWQFITSFRLGPGRFKTLLAVDNEVYALSCITDGFRYGETSVRVECYNPEENKWTIKTRLQDIRKEGSCEPRVICSMKLFKGLITCDRGWNRSVLPIGFLELLKPSLHSLPTVPELKMHNHEYSCLL